MKLEVLQSMVDNGYKTEAITYDLMIYASCKTKRVEVVLDLFDIMKDEGANPMCGTCSYILNGIFKARGFDEAHSFLIHQSGKNPNLDSGNYEYLIMTCHR